MQKPYYKTEMFLSDAFFSDLFCLHVDINLTLVRNIRRNACPQHRVEADVQSSSDSHSDGSKGQLFPCRCRFPS